MKKNILLSLLGMLSITLFAQKKSHKSEVTYYGRVCAFCEQKFIAGAKIELNNSGKSAYSDFLGNFVLNSYENKKDTIFTVTKVGYDTLQKPMSAYVGGITFYVSEVGKPCAEITPPIDPPKIYTNDTSGLVLDVNIPREVLSGNEVKIAIYLKNYSDRVIEYSMGIDYPKSLSSKDTFQEIFVAPKSSEVVYATAKANDNIGKGLINIQTLWAFGYNTDRGLVFAEEGGKFENLLFEINVVSKDEKLKKKSCHRRK